MYPRCEYYQDTDPDYHALCWDGQRNTSDPTDQWECAACGHKHTAHLGTPMYRLKPSKEQVALAIHPYASGWVVVIAFMSHNHAFRSHHSTLMVKFSLEAAPLHATDYWGE